MKNCRRLMVVWFALLSASCGASSGPAAPKSESDFEATEDEEVSAAAEGRDSDIGATSESDGADSPQADEPQFTPGMSVIEARNAVPDTVQRLNIEQEALAAPLMEPSLYEPCALQGHHHFKVRVAVWDGRAVGLDVTTQPRDEKLESCLRQQISDIEWKDKAKSINTVEYSY